MNRLDEVVHPSECSFLIAVPINREDFLSDLHDVQKDFIRSHYLHLTLNDDAKWYAYKPTADDVSALIDRLQGLGVKVVPRTTKRDLIVALQTSKVIILFAHWRSGLLRVEEIQWGRLDVSLLPESLKLQESLIGEQTSTTDKKIWTQKLNDLLLTKQLCSHPWFGNGPNQIPASREHRLYLNRIVLDKALPGVFGPNTSVEFGDRLVGLEAIKHSFQSSFRETIDLSVCNSILLAELIKAQAPDCLVVATRLPASLDYRVTFYGSLFKLLRPGRPYIRTIEKLRSEIRDFWRGRG
jgi:hypothetical protein